MGMAAHLAFAYVAGLVIGGIVASIMELTSGDQPSFGAPFFSRDHLARFFFTVLAAGPFMLVNDALAARRNGLLASTELTWLFATASIWALAIGTASIGAVAALSS